MKLYPATSEFSRFVAYYQNLYRDKMMTPEDMMDFAFGALDNEQKRKLAIYLDACLDGTHGEDELIRLWNSQGPQMTTTPIIGFLRRVRNRLDAFDQ